MSEESIVTTIRMKPKTAQQLERMKILVNAVSTSDMIKKSIEMSEMFINTVVNGGSILIQDRQGKQTEIRIMGINS